MKQNIDDFNGMKDFIISIVTVVAWVLIGTIIVIGYFTIETKGESIIISIISTIFTAISSIGVISAFAVYFLMKRDNENEQRRRDSIAKGDLLYLCEYYLEVISEINSFSSETKNIDAVEIEGSIIDGRYLSLFTINKHNGKSSHLFIEYDFHGHIHSIINNGHAFGNEINKNARILLGVIDYINSYIKKSLIRMYLNKLTDQKFKIDSIKGYSATNEYINHYSMLNKIKCLISS
ncbi:TPA: hypothetical protein M5802_003276 [Morganella morganii]|uniref:hypothetical protein n=1 Tax=Morganella morganii TaxID=582 RepID=UPI00280EFCAB|nr:hypothetical protein [Morganella morganii]HCC5749519.1 hypothetical protein [Morganella morganii]HDU8547779.1 hypothetical protein [Morganella morganii]HEJ0089044.1 hypothetical protein [Morganella morganii]HEJ0265215.1 hypothetical protein [Morganella morganii]